MFLERQSRSGGEIKTETRKREGMTESRVHPSLGDEVEAERFAKERCTRDLHPPTRDEKTWPTTRVTGRSYRRVCFFINYSSHYAKNSVFFFKYIYNNLLSTDIFLLNVILKERQERDIKIDV